MANVDLETMDGFKPYLRSHDLFKIAGFYFLNINPLIGDNENYWGDIIDWDYFKIVGRKIFNAYVDPKTGLYAGVLDSYDKNSNNPEYLEELSRLKSKFKLLDIDSQCRCLKYNYTYKNEGYNAGYAEKIIYIFYFDDIFVPTTTEVKGFKISNVSSTVGWTYPLLDFLQFGLDSDVYINSLYKVDSSYGRAPAVGIPLKKSIYGVVDGVSFTNGLFFKDNIFYFFRINAYPREHVEIFNLIVVSYDVFVIPMLKKCCIAECFGITE